MFPYLVKDPHWGDYPELSEWAQSNHKDPHKNEAEESELEKAWWQKQMNGVTMAKNIGNLQKGKGLGSLEPLEGMNFRWHPQTYFRLLTSSAVRKEICVILSY